MVQQWYHVIAAANGLTIVPEPAEEQLYGPGGTDTVGDAERERLEQAREQYVLQVHRLVEQMGCWLHAAGSEDYQPDYFVAALCPRPESDPVRSPFTPLPDLAVGPEVLERLRRFCQTMGIPYEEPRWYLVRSYSLD